MSRVRMIHTTTGARLGGAVLENTTASERVLLFRRNQVRLEPDPVSTTSEAPRQGRKKANRRKSASKEG